MNTFLILMLVFSPFIILFTVLVEVDKKQYNTGTRAVDKHIKKTRLLAVNGVEYVTEKGALSGAIVGHMLAGNIGALLGAMSARQVHTDNEFIFLVLYDDGKKGAKKETEKVLQSSERFRFLVSKLEDDLAQDEN